MGNTPKQFNKKILASAVAASLTLSGGALAQDGNLEEVLVTGIRASLEASMDTKRNAVGVVDAINAEDIGKFPDTNLAESLQRITGVAIDRANGEGSRITVRGFGPDFNMVTLNGRTMPGGSTYGGSSGADSSTRGGNARAFDFANLASDAIAGIEVYKTGKANLSTGGIGATVNILTSRPLDNPGLKFSLGVKALNDTTNRIGDDITPELSGIYSWSDSESKFGVALTGSYQVRDSGYTGATVNDWNIGVWGEGGDDLYQQDREGQSFTEADIFENRPGDGQLYARPNDIRYAFSDTSRTRTNGQLTFQFAPSDSITLTADYTLAKNDIEEFRGEVTNWVQNGANLRRVVFDDSLIATPRIIAEDYRDDSGVGFADIGLEQQFRSQENTLESYGFNVDFEVNDRLKLSLDAHDSSMESLPTGPGRAGELAVGLGSPTKEAKTLFFGDTLPYWTYSFNDCAHQTTRLTDDNPNNDQFLSNCNGVFEPGDVSSTVMRIFSAEQISDVTQVRIDGQLDIGEEGRFDFGIDYREMSSTTASYNGNNAQVLGGWGADNPGEFPDGMIQPFNIAAQFDDFDTAYAPGIGFRADARQLADYLVSAPQYAAAQPYVGIENTEIAGTVRNSRTVDTIGEDTLAAYAQYSWSGELGRFPYRVLAGVRYEDTDVQTESRTPPVLYLQWQSDNDFATVSDNGAAIDSGLPTSNSYDNLLPSFDFDISFTEELTGRFSYSKTIARAGLGDLRTSVNTVSLNGSTLVGGNASANTGNAQLIPQESTNMDVSLEWYFADTSYVSLGYFDKKVKNFIGTANVTSTLFDVRDQTAGPRAQAAAAALRDRGILVDNANLHTMMVILADATQFPNGADDFTNTNEQRNALGQDCSSCDILPSADDPLMEFEVSQPVNSEDARIYGLEFALQHFFGESGFGFQFNYTLVDGDIEFDNLARPSEQQFALQGLSDTANLVLMYENYGIQARLAYNWRDKFLNETNIGGSNNPRYVEAYSQVDLNVSYSVTEQVAVFVEAINLTGEDRRVSGRNEAMLWGLEDLGARYALGARYTF